MPFEKYGKFDEIQFNNKTVTKDRSMLQQEKNLKHFMLSERSQTQKNTYCMVPFIQNFSP